VLSLWKSATLVRRARDAGTDRASLVSARSRDDRAAKRLRCAIYTRVSTDEHGLEQDFDSVDAQREPAEGCVRSPAHEGWALIKTA
jgi:hypothetical protein